MTIAALFVDPGGVYSGIPGVDLWDEKRDARRYAGTHPVVAHPPCSRWCQLAGINQARYGHAIGDDGGCFASALESVRKWGGVLEHPAFTHAWRAHGLNRPPVRGWSRASLFGDIGWVTHVEQGMYGHPARKSTWLYAVGITSAALRWGRTPDAQITRSVSNCTNRGGVDRPRMDHGKSSATPPAFRDELLSIARSVR